MKVGLAGIAVLVLVLAGCGGSSDEWTSAQKTYHSAVTKLNKAHEDFNNFLDKSQDEPNTTYVGPLNTFVAALQTFNETIDKTAWPASVRQDAKVLAQADTTLIQVLETFSDELQHNPSPDLASLGNDLGAATDNAADVATQFENDLINRGPQADGMSESSDTPSPSATPNSTATATSSS